MLKYSLILVMLATIFSCSTVKKTPDRTVEMSFGGGFTGAYTTYRVSESGAFYKSEGIVSQFDSVGVLPEKVVKQLFSYYDNTNLDSLDMRSYGNMNYSITMKKDSTKHRIVWEKNQKGSKNLQAYYDLYSKIMEIEIKKPTSNIKEQLK